MTAPATLHVGDPAWAIICGNETGDSGRRTVEGPARVEIVAIDGDRYTVRIVRGGGPVHNGAIHSGQRRSDIYAVTGPEHDAFGAAVRFLYSPHAEMR